MPNLFIAPGQWQRPSLSRVSAYEVKLLHKSVRPALGLTNPKTPINTLSQTF